MLRVIGQNTVLIVAIVIGVTVGGFVAPWLLSERGAIGPAVLQAVSTPRAIGAVVIALAIATALAIGTARVTNTVVGAFVLGAGLFGLAWRTETLRELAQIGSLGEVALETFVWWLLMLGAVALLFRLAGPLRDVPPVAGGTEPNPWVSVDAFKSAAAGALVLPIVWVLARTPAQGQVIGAVFCGAMLAGLAGRMLAPHVQPILLLASPVLFGAIGHVAAAVLQETPLDAALIAGDVSALSLPMPIDYACGSLMGVAVGLGWARSFLHHEEEEG